MVYILYLVAETECMRSTEFSVEKKKLGLIQDPLNFQLKTKKGLQNSEKYYWKIGDPLNC